MLNKLVAKAHDVKELKAFEGLLKNKLNKQF